MPARRPASRRKSFKVERNRHLDPRQRPRHAGQDDRRLLDYTVRVSSREAYVSPTRGAQGNALKTIVAMPFVLDEEMGKSRSRRMASGTGSPSRSTRFGKSRSSSMRWCGTR